LQSALCAPLLELLEQRRNLIVHRAGMVDKRFIDKTSLGYELGTLLPLDDEVISESLNASIDAGCELLKCLDEWLAHNPI